MQSLTFLERKRRKILAWLSPESFSRMHEALLEKRVDGTGDWFLSHARFKDFIAAFDTRALLCFGIRIPSPPLYCTLTSSRRR